MTDKETDERQFGPYRLIHLIATGGMAEVYLAKVRGVSGFEKFVAVKMLHKNFSEDERFIRMIIDEAKIAVQLQHPNIVQTFDLGRVGTTYYLAMEYIAGADLFRVLRAASLQNRKMPIDVAVHVAKEVCAGLDYAHTKLGPTGDPLKIVHRDISPQNALLSYEGQIKIVDFGIAKATLRASHTTSGVIKGKYYYMSPEQAWGDPLDHRSDIFSAGVLIYEMLVGQMLYLEEDMRKLVAMVREADIAPPNTLRKDVPDELVTIVMKALTKKADDRYQSAQEFGTALDKFLHKTSPAFKSAQVSAFVRATLDADGKGATDSQPKALVPKELATRGVGGDAILSSRNDFADEHSVIFEVPEEMRNRDKAADKGPADKGPADKSPADKGPADKGPADKDPAEQRKSVDKSPASEAPLGDFDDDEPTTIQVSAEATQSDDTLDWQEQKTAISPSLFGDDGATDINAPALQRPPVAPAQAPAMLPRPAPTMAPPRAGGPGQRTILMAAGVTAVLGIAALLVGLLKTTDVSRAPGGLQIISAPKGANVFVNGTALGTAPVSIGARLAPGATYVVRVEMDRYEPWKKQGKYPTAGQSVTLIAPLVPITGDLKVESSPPGAQVYLGVRLGNTPLHRASIDPFAEKIIEVRKRGYKPQRATIDWNSRWQALVKFELKESDFIDD